MKILATVLLAGVTLIGCTPAETAEVKPEPVKTTQVAKPVVKTTPTKAAVDRKTVFLQVMRNEYPVLNGVEDKVILDSANDVCTLFKKGYTFPQVAGAVLNAGIEPDMAGYLIGASTAAFCPKYTG